MAEQDKDLPLVVAEILIEMHGMNSRMERVENVLLDLVGNTKQMSDALVQMSEVMAAQQRENNRRFELLMEADRANTTMLINAFKQEAGATRERLGSIEDRLERLENK